MIIEPPPIEIFGVYDRGIPNQERIVLRANRSVEITNHFLMLGIKGVDDTFFPFPDQSLWLGRKHFAVPSWLFVYTGKGTDTISQEANTHEPLFTIFWGKPSVIFTNSATFPALVCVSDIAVAPEVGKTLADIRTEKPPTGSDLLREMLKLLETNKPYHSP